MLIVWQGSYNIIVGSPDTTSNLLFQQFLKVSTFILETWKGWTMNTYAVCTTSNAFVLFFSYSMSQTDSEEVVSGDPTIIWSLLWGVRSDLVHAVEVVVVRALQTVVPVGAGGGAAARLLHWEGRGGAGRHTDLAHQQGEDWHETERSGHHVTL